MHLPGPGRGIFSLAKGHGCFPCVNICVDHSSTHLLESNPYITDLNTSLCCLLKHAEACRKRSPFLSDMLRSLGRLLLCKSDPKPHFRGEIEAGLCFRYGLISLPVLTWPSVLSLLLSLALAPSGSSLKLIPSMGRRPPLPSLGPHLHQVGRENCHRDVFGPKMCWSDQGDQGAWTLVLSSADHGGCCCPPAPQHCGSLGQSHLSPSVLPFVVLKKQAENPGFSPCW